MSIFNFFKNTALTTDQQAILSKLAHFLDDGNRQIFVLRGYAGTGKTFIAKGLISYIRNELKRQVCCIAPTGRAAKILHSKTGHETATIHKCIYQVDSIKTGAALKADRYKFFYQLAGNQYGNQSVFIVDEASMLSDMVNDSEFFCFGSGRLMQDLVRFVNFNKHPNSKIIFIGDNAQLPPVGMNYSPALLAEYSEKEFQLTVQEGEMVEVVRQQQKSGILQTATSLREGLINQKYGPFNLQQEHDICPIDRSEVVDQYLNTLQSGKSSIVIVHSNRQALAYNLEIRQSLRPHSYHDITPDDLLLIVQNNYNTEPTLMNGEFVKVLDVLKDPEDVNVVFNVTQEDLKQLPNKNNIRVLNSKKRTILIRFRFRYIKIEVENEQLEQQEMFVFVFENMLFDAQATLSSIEQRALYIDFTKRFNRNFGYMRGTTEYKDKFKEELRSDLYFNALRAKFGYAITCHKSQGGEWEAPFVDFATFMDNNTSAYYRWAYTAITRASSYLYAVNFNIGL